MRILLILLFLYTLDTRINSQSKEFVRVLDTLSKEPIAYATIVNKNNQFGLYSNELGLFDKKTLLEEEIIVSCIGYHTKKIKINKSVKYIYLKPKAYTISEVTVKSKKFKNTHLGYYKYNVNPSISYAYECGTELAVLIENPMGEEAVFSKIYFAVSRLTSEKNNYNLVSVFKINLYSVTENNEVGSLINKKNLLYKSSVLKKKTVLDISNQNIIMPANGVFVAIEWIGAINEITNEIDRDYDGEPSVYLTTKPMGVIVYKRNLLYDNIWKLYDSDDKRLKSYNFKNYIPRISIIVVR